MTLTEQIRQKARELLENKTVDCVIGYERATDGTTARPLFAYEPDQTAKFIFDRNCVHNLTKYLLNRKDKVTGIVVKPCDSRAINVLLNESQIKRDKVYIIGVLCSDKIEGDTQAACQICHHHQPVIYDFLVGETPTADKEYTETYPDVTAMEGQTAAERRAFWKEQFSRCIRCYACRQVCPGCYCPECFVERLDPLWVGIRIAPGENEMWNTIRAFHLAGRCIACKECERVCPVNIPLSLLNRKLEKEMLEKFQFLAGADSEKALPFSTYDKEEKLGYGE